MMFSLTIFFFFAAAIYLVTYALIGVMEGSTVSIEYLMLNTTKYEGIQQFYFTSLILSLTFLILRDLIDLRQHLQAIFYFYHNRGTGDNGVNMMKLRTLQINSTN